MILQALLNIMKIKKMLSWRSVIIQKIKRLKKFHNKLSHLIYLNTDDILGVMFMNITDSTITSLSIISVSSSAEIFKHF